MVQHTYICSRTNYSCCEVHQRPFMLQLLCKEKEQTLTSQSVTTVSQVQVINETQKVWQGKIIVCSSVWMCCWRGKGKCIR